MPPVPKKAAPEELPEGLVRLRGRVTAPVCRACGGAGRTSTNTGCHPCDGTGLAGGVKMKWALEKLNGKGIRA